MLRLKEQKTKTKDKPFSVIGMEIFKKQPWLIYLLCGLIAIGPGFFVWMNFESIESEEPEKQEQQVMYISLISMMPLITVLSYALYKALKGYFRL